MSLDKGIGLPQRWDPATFKLVRDAIALNRDPDNATASVLLALANEGLLIPPAGYTVDLYAAFKTPAALTAPWTDHTLYRIRNSAEAALEIARMWGSEGGGEALAAKCTQTFWANGREYRTPWVRIADSLGDHYLDNSSGRT